MFGWLLNNAFILFVGYCIAVLFPIPVLSSWVIEKWAALGAWLKEHIPFIGGN
jgi:hypothetical protein